MKKFKISLAAVITVFLIVQTVFCLSRGIYASAEETPEVSVSAPATVAAGEEASIMVNIDCQDKVFTSGSVKVQLSADSFTGVSA
ncbi:MAG: hypothetical protein IJZ90_00110, partial [Clostridia bacterium]|nr:hypothetical protein [Clostridia bacterium]